MHPVERSFLEIASSDMAALSAALDLPDRTRREIRDLLPVLMGSWGNRPLGDQPPTQSDITDDHTPFEYSIALGEGVREVRMLLEPQSENPQEVTTPPSNWRATHHVLDALEDQGLIDLSRFRLVRDLFEPHTPDAGFGLWLGVVFSADHTPFIKVYMDPLTAGKAQAPILVAEMMEKLGMDKEWEWLTRYVMTYPGANIVYLSLDLTSGDSARVKIYTGADTPTPHDLDSFLSVLPGYTPGMIEKYCQDLFTPDVIFDQRPPLLTWHMTQGNKPEPDTATAHLPARSHMLNDQMALDQEMALMPAPEAMILDKAVHAVAHRDLSQGKGLLAWLSPRVHNGQLERANIYLSAEGYSF